jgi:hypothetical protein
MHCKYMTIRRKELLQTGWTDYQIGRAVADGVMTPILPGRYVTDVSWNAIAELLLARGGALAVLSHRAAASLHRFDMYTDDPRPRPEITVPYGSTMHPSNQLVHRTRSLDECDVVTNTSSDGFRTTNKARTVFDLARDLSVADLEIVVESALRSLEPTDPSAWDEECLLRLQQLAKQNRPGAGKLRLVLGQRPADCRPTGSIYETRSLQALRGVGLGNLTRQCTLVVVDEATGITKVVYPDFGEFNVGVTIEPDGEKYHKERRAEERKRDNHIGKAVKILRFDHSTPLAEMARQVRAEINAASSKGWPDPRWEVTRTTNRIEIRIPKPR